MLSKENRLKKKKDFEILFKEGRFVGGGLVDVKVWKVESEKYPKRGYLESELKIGFVVSKKNHKSAVTRNKIKRQMREVTRLLLKESKLKKGFMLVLLSKPKILESKYQEISKDIFEVFKKAGLLV